MDYHGSRLRDYSLIVRDDKGHIVALLPGHLAGSTYLTHGGLTFGGFLTDTSMKLPLLLRVFDATLTRLSGEGVARVLYKPIPHIYHRVPAEEDRYALFLAGAHWVRSGMLAVLTKGSRPAYQERRRRSIRKAKERGLEIRRTEDYAAYWRVLSDLLRERFGAQPVHTLDEIQGLRTRLPDNIELHVCFEGSEMLAGIVVYRSDKVARAQYIASTSEGRAAGALDLLTDHLINSEYAAVDYFDLGTSDEEGGKVLNEGLMDQKEGYGARSVALDQYSIDLTSWRAGTVAGALR
jgi:hypothetical protein